MKIVCGKCGKTYEIPDERLKTFTSDVALPCKVCKEKIVIKVQGDVNKDAEKDNYLSGEALKKRIFIRIKDLPPMPQVAQKGRQVIADPQSSFKDLAKVIETDQSIATRVLKIANSPYYGVRGKVTSIQHASVILGMKTLAELLTLACSSSVMGTKLDGYGLDSGDLWKHSLTTAGCARSLAQKKKPELAEDAFSAGLIHDCGKLILDPYILERRSFFDDYMETSDRSFLEAERKVLGFDHAEIAAEVCEKWQIPKQLTNAIAYHHKPSSLRFSNELAFIVHVADSIAMMSGIGVGVDGVKYEVDQKAVESLSLDQNQISLLMAESAEFVDQTISSF